MGTGDKRRPVVLVVDDDLGVRESLQETLRDDYEVLEAADGQTALDIVRDRPVDVVLLDILMPGLDGIEVLKHLRQEGCRARVILVTAVSAISSVVAAMKLGAFDYVTKPFEPDDLLALVERAVTPPRTAVLLVGGPLGLRAAWRSSSTCTGTPAWPPPPVLPPGLPPRPVMAASWSTSRIGWTLRGYWGRSRRTSRA
jgi:DNA-binding response OmpR family regulator